MKGAPPDEVDAHFRSERMDEDTGVVVLLYDEFHSPYDEDYITAPYTYENLEDVPDDLPDKPRSDYILLTDDERISYEDHINDRGE